MVSPAKYWASKENKAASGLRTLNLVKETSAISQVNATYQGILQRQSRRRASQFCLGAEEG